MHILVIGAAGMVGRKLVARLAKDRGLAGEAVDAVTLSDGVVPAPPEGFSGRVEAVTADLSAPGEASALAARRPDLIFHLAAVVSGEAEADFDKGHRVNLDGTRAFLEAIRLEGAREPYRPRVVFTSSIAVFGAPFPAAIGDAFLSAPLTIYGTRKAIGIRLPTICVRPGRPDLAASGFFSGILREPLAGREAVLPVGEEVRHWFASPRAAVGFLLHAAALDFARLGDRRNTSLPGLCATVSEEIEAPRRAGGERAVRLIRRVPDPVIAGIVAGWPQDFGARRAESLGFRAESTMDEIVRARVDDELGGVVGG